MLSEMPEMSESDKSDMSEMSEMPLGFPTFRQKVAAATERKVKA